MQFINGTCDNLKSKMASLLAPACVGMVLAHTPPEEALTAVAAGCTVMFPSSFICAYRAQRCRSLGLTRYGQGGRSQRLCNRTRVEVKQCSVK